MWYLIEGYDVAGSLAARIEHRSAHRARLQALTEQGRLLVAGPIPAIDSPDPGEAGFTGSLIIAEFASLADAQDWAAAEPYLLNGVYAKVSVQPFVKTLP